MTEQNQSRFELGNMDRIHRRPVPKNPGSTRARAIEDAIKKELAASLQDDELNYSTLHLDSSKTGLPVSIILVTLLASASGKSIASVFSLLVETPDLRLAPRTDRFDNRPVETPTVIGDIYNAGEYWNIVVQFAKQYLGTNVEVNDAGGEVVSHNYPLDSDNVHRLVYAAANGCYTNLNTQIRLDSAKPLNVAFRDPAEHLTGRLNFSGDQGFDLCQHPIRRDVLVEMDASRPSAGGSDFLTNSGRMLTQVGGFVEPVFAPVNANSREVQQPFSAHFVITDLQTNFDSRDREAVLLALSSATMLSNNYAYADAFRPRYTVRGKGGKDDIDLRDIGALGYALVDGNQAPTKIDTKSDSFLQNFGKFVREHFRDGLIYSIDIPEIGEMSAVLDMFRCAAEGNPKAVQAVIQAANNLTDGHFGQIFQGDRILIDNGNRVHMGYYDRGDGVIVDARTIDNTAVLNLFGKAANRTALDFMESFSPNIGHPTVRLAVRGEVIHEVTGGRFVHTGYAGRYTFYGDFIIALNEACDRAGLVVNPANISSGLGGGAVMGGYDYSAMAVRSVSGMFVNRASQNQRPAATPRGRFGG